MYEVVATIEPVVTKRANVESFSSNSSRTRCDRYENIIQLLIVREY